MARLFHAALLLVTVSIAFSQIAPQCTSGRQTVPDGKPVAAPGAPCQFPFEYAGQTFTACTPFQNQNVPWCYVEGAAPGTWGDCADCPAHRCGDGVTDAGEDCDPPGGCCGQNCKFASKTTVCRAPAPLEDCDAPDFCPGDSVNCPEEDAKVKDGTPCGPVDTNSVCVAGHCTNKGALINFRSGDKAKYSLKEGAYYYMLDGTEHH